MHRAVLLSYLDDTRLNVATAGIEIADVKTRDRFVDLTLLSCHLIDQSERVIPPVDPARNSQFKARLSDHAPDRVFFDQHADVMIEVLPEIKLVRILCNIEKIFEIRPLSELFSTTTSIPDPVQRDITILTQRRQNIYHGLISCEIILDQLVDDALIETLTNRCRLFFL